MKGVDKMVYIGVAIQMFAYPIRNTKFTSKIYKIFRQAILINSKMPKTDTEKNKFPLKYQENYQELSQN